MVQAAEEMPACESPARAKSPWGRTALIIQGLAWAFGLTTFLILASGWLDEDESAREFAGVGSVGWAACLVFWLWSVILAVRALLKRERLRLPVLVFVLSLILVAMLAGSLWRPILRGQQSAYTFEEFAIAWGVPVFVPFGATAGGVAGLLGWALTNWCARRDKARGGGPWTRRRWLTRWLAWSIEAFAMLTVILLPFPLYLYCVVTNPTVSYRPYQRAPDWRNALIPLMPNYVKRAVHDALDGSLNPTLKKWHEAVIWQGDPPASVFLPHLVSPSSGLCSLAWGRVSSLEPETALAMALSIGDGVTAAPANAQQAAGTCLGNYYLKRHEPLDKIRSYLRCAQSQRTPFLDELLNALWSKPREFPQDYWKTLASGSSPYRYGALCILISNVTPEERARLGAEMAKDPDPARRVEAARAMVRCRDQKAVDGLIPVYLADESIDVRFQAISGMIKSFGPTDKAAGYKQRWAPKLAELLDDPDAYIRRCVMWFFSQVLPVGGPRVHYWCGSPVPETPLEIAERERVRAAVQEWLKKQKDLAPGK